MSFEANSTQLSSLTRRLSTKLLVAVLAMSLVPLITVALVSVNRAKSYLAAEAGTQMEVLAIETGDKIDRTLMERYRDVQAFAANPLVLQSASERADFLDFLVTKYGFYDLMVITNLEGQIVGVNGVDELGESISSASLLGSDVSDTEWFQAVSSGEVRQGTSYYGAAHSSPLVEAVYGESRLTLPFSAPIFDRSGQMVAIWHNEASFDRTVAETIDQVKADLSVHDFTTAQSQVLRADGLVLHDSAGMGDQTEAMATNLADDGLGAATALVETGETGYTQEASEDGVQQIIGFATANGVADFDGYGWGILMRVDSAEASQRSDSLQTFMLIFGFFAVIAVATLAFYLARWISRPVQIMSARASEIAGGNMNVEQLAIERDDELGDMAIAFNDMVATLSVASSQASAIADKHLTHPVLKHELPGAFGEAIQSMVGSIQEMVDRLSSKSSALAEGARQLGKASQATADEVEQTNSRAEVVSHSGDEVSSSVTTVAAAIEELNASIQEVSSNASVASNTATDAVAVARSASERIADLGQSSEEVGNVVQVIKSIAEQTNLLALNATIEAARAGEAGKGFAVVANEVKELANQTALATEQISDRILNIQTQTASAIEANSLIGSTIEQINEVSTTIAAAVNEQSSATSEIGRSMEDAAAGADEIARSITEVANAASGARKSTGQTQQSAQGIAKIATELDQLIAEYH